MAIKVVPHEVVMAIEKRNLKLQHELDTALQKLIADTREADAKRAELFKQK